MIENDLQVNYSKTVSPELIEQFEKYYKKTKQDKVKLFDFDTNRDNNLCENEIKNGLSFMKQALFTNNYEKSMLPIMRKKSFFEKVKAFLFGEKKEEPQKLIGTQRNANGTVIFYEHEQTENSLDKSIFKDEQGKIIEIYKYSEDINNNLIKCEKYDRTGKKSGHKILNLSNSSQEIAEFTDNLKKIIKTNSDNSSVEEIYTNNNLSQKIMRDKDDNVLNIYDYDLNGNEIKSTKFYQKDKNLIKEEETKNSKKISTFDHNNNFIKSEETKQINEQVTMREYKYADGTVIKINENIQNKTKIIQTQYPKGHKKELEQHYTNKNKGINITSIVYSNGREEESHYDAKTNTIKEIKRFPSGEQQIFYYINNQLKKVIRYDSSGERRNYNVVNEELIEVRESL